MDKTEWLDLITRAVKDGIKEGVKNRLSTNYDNPLDALIQQVINANTDSVKDLFAAVFKDVVQDEAFRTDIIKQTRSIMARTLVTRFGGEIEKSINALKSDPTTRARITLAIEEIVATAKQ